MGKEKRGPLALELWAKQLVDSYPGVCVRNMTTSWRNGLAFCALIHRFRPDLIEYDKLDPEDIIGNCSLAFEVAESKLGIPSLLDPVDMAKMDIPDKLSILTYVAQFYNAFKNSELKSPSRDVREEVRSADDSVTQSPQKGLAKRKSNYDENEVIEKVRRSMPKTSVLLSSSSTCCECKNPVFISERVLFMKKLYHRSCFRCSKCKNLLNPHIVDVTDDGSLFCLEKTCHTELFMHVESSKIKDDNLSAENVNTANETPVKQEDPNKPGVDMNPAHEESSFRDSISVPHSGHGDISNVSKVLPERSPRLNSKLVNFAGALLADTDGIKSNAPDEKDLKCNEAPIETLIKNNGTEQLVKVCDSEVIEETCKIIEAEHEPDLTDAQNNCNNSGALELERTNEDTSIRDNTILTITDTDNVDESLENKSQQESEDCNTECQSMEVPSPDSALSQSIEPENEIICDTLENEDFDTAEKEIPQIIEKKDTEKPENSADKQVSDIVPPNVVLNGQIPDNDSQPTGEENMQPSPIPRKRTPIIPPTNSCVESPTPVPKPRPEKPPVPRPPDMAADTVSKKKDYYPSELNPFESDDEESSKCTPSTSVDATSYKNPFEESDDEDGNSQSLQVPPSPKPRSSTPKSEINNNQQGGAGVSRQNAANFNVPPPRPPPPRILTSVSPDVNTSKPYNPFEDDDDDDIGDYDDRSLPQKVDDTSSISSKTSDLSSSISSAPTPVPRSLNVSDSESFGSVKARSRKSRRAPLPPTMSSQPTLQGDAEKKKIPVPTKLMKGLSISSPPAQPTYRKKRRAPPPKRRVEPLPEAAIKTEFSDLEIKLKELERQGVSLESQIRSVMNDNDTDDSESSEKSSNDHLEEMMIQFWNIVNEKNDILRRQTELEYLRRGHRLEEMQAELEFKLRVHMDTPEGQRLPNHNELEQLLLQQLLKLVDERNEVVEWLDYHRQQEKAEDLLVSNSMAEFSNSSKAVEKLPFSQETKTKQKDKKKLKLGIFKKKNKKSKTAEAES